MKIIVIDQDLMVLDFFKNLEKKMNFKVEGVDKAAKALFFLKNPKECTIVFMGKGQDPFQQSIEACQYVNPNIPIFLMIQNSDTAEIKKAYFQGIRGTISKPLSMDKIAETVQEIEVTEFFKENLKSVAQKEGALLGSLKMDDKVKSVMEILREAEELEHKKNH